MTAPPPARSLRDLRSLTPARVGLGRAGISLPTEALLEFTLAHARARDAVHAAFDAENLAAELRGLGLATEQASSLAYGRADYLKRPDLGRTLDPDSRRRLAARGGACDLAFVIGDGLSPAAVDAHAANLMRVLLPRLAAAQIAVGPAIVASGARVALGDDIGELLGARMVAVLIGERPGLSTPHSLGIYLTFAPKPGRSDAERNCVSNLHATGLSYDEAAFKVAWLAGAAQTRQITGVALKDESGAMVPALGGTASA